MHTQRKESSSKREMIKEVKSLGTSELLLLRNSYRADIRSLDDLNFKIISIISTITIGIITAGTALKNPDYLVFFFAAIAIINCTAAKMLLKNRISVLEKTWYVCYLESKLPKEIRKFSPFGFKHFDKPTPEYTAYRSMIGVHQILIIIGFIWAFSSLYLFYGYSQHIIANPIASLLGKTIAELPILFYLDNLVWSIAIILFGVLTAYVWKCRVQHGYIEKWKNSIWSKKRYLLESIKKQFEGYDKKETTTKND